MRYDAIVIGTGVAGLSAALKLAAHGRVAVVTKSRLGQGGSTPWAQGGVAVALGSDDSPNLHAQDTLEVAVGLGTDEAVAVLTGDGPARVRELIDWGARFDTDAQGNLAMGREAAHSRRRVVHAADATGAEIARVLVEQVRASGAAIFEETFVTELVRRRGRVVGIRGRSPQGDLALTAPAVVLASGGCGQLYQNTTNPRECTGDGLALAFRAGARLRDLEFVQFHPTALDVSSQGAPMPLVTEALRGEGATLVDELGERFMVDLHPLAELAPRDVVARGIWQHRRAGHLTCLDARHLGEEFPVHFPTVFGLCGAAGIDPRTSPIPVSPAAHYHMGGVETDAHGRTSLDGLWACGEVSATGVHGANRLASNSLLEGLVFGVRVAQDILDRALTMPADVLPTSQPAVWTWRDSNPLLVRALREVMWSEVGLVRTQSGLARALAQLERYGERPAVGEAANMLLAARLITTAALARTESRGAHYRLDYPNTSETWRVHLVVSNEGGRRVALERVS